MTLSGKWAVAKRLRINSGHALTPWCPFLCSGWGDLPNVQAKPEPSSWGEPAPNAPSVDNGTSAWGKPPRGCGGWGDGGHESAGPYGRGNVPPGSGPKQGKHQEAGVISVSVHVLACNALEEHISASRSSEGVSFSLIVSAFMLGERSREE